MDGSFNSRPHSCEFLTTLLTATFDYIPLMIWQDWCTLSLIFVVVFWESYVHVRGWNIFGCRCVLRYIRDWHVVIGKNWNTLAPSVVFLINDCSSFFCFPFGDDVIPRYFKGMSLVRTFISIFISVDDDIICIEILVVELI